MAMAYQKLKKPLAVISLVAAGIVGTNVYNRVNDLPNVATTELERALGRDLNCDRMIGGPNGIPLRVERRKEMFGGRVAFGLKDYDLTDSVEKTVGRIMDIYDASHPRPAVTLPQTVHQAYDSERETVSDLIKERIDELTARVQPK